jgi:3-deoxy-manno-octulosonate cytidylyltransferase (CMP-KDO synthetase)
VANPRYFGHRQGLEAQPRRLRACHIPAARQYVAPANPIDHRRRAGTAKGKATASAESMKPLVVIPARMSSSRLPGKPLADIHGAPMIVHVWRRARAAGVGPVLVAAGESEIVEAVEKAGGRALLTRADHPSGSDRVWEAVEIADPHGHHDVIVNLQGDLPMLEPSAIVRVLEPLSQPAVDIATIAIEIHDEAERDNPNMVKAVAPLGPDRPIARALYFTRARCPAGPGPHFHHIGIYAFRRAALQRFVRLPPDKLEQWERLEQLRALAAGMRIDVALVDTAPFGVDTPADLERARALLKPHGPSPNPQRS